MKQEYLSKKLQNSPQSGLVLQGEQRITVEEEAEEITVLKIEEENFHDIHEYGENNASLVHPVALRDLKSCDVCTQCAHDGSLVIPADQTCAIRNEYTKTIERLDPRNSKLYSNLRELNLKESQLGWKDMRKFIKEIEFLNNLQILDLSQNQLQDKGVWILVGENKNAWNSLKSLNLADNLIGKFGAKVISAYLTTASFKKLDLSRNSIGNEGVKFIAENSSWAELEVLILNRIEIDSQGAELLVTNESWRNLQELYLQENPALSDQSAVWLSCNHLPWRKLRKLILDHSDIRELGVEFLRRNRVCREISSLNSKSERTSTARLHKKLNRSPEDADYSCKKLTTFGENKCEASLLKRNEIYSRGGKGSENQILIGLLDKINQYKMKILNDKSFENELNLYVDPLGKHSSDADSEPFEVTFGVQNYLLSSESKLRVLLLTGEAGIGKTLFCNHLQRVLISAWDCQHHELEERPWLPILVDLSNLKLSESKSTAEALPAKVLTIPEVLSRDLSLNEAEIKLLQDDTADSSSLLPRLLFIFDDCIEILQKSSASDLTTPKACINSNFYIANGFETEWEHAKVIITNRAGSLSNHTRADLLFGPVDKSTHAVIPNTFAEFLLQPFNDTQISLYLKKFVVLGDSEEFVEEEEKSSFPSSNSWKSLRKYENFIELYGLRELIRTPMALRIFVNILPEISQEQKAEKAGKKAKKGGKKGKAAPNKSNKWTRYKFYRIYTTRVINATIDRFLSSMEKGNKVQMDEQLRSLLSEKLKQQLQNIALGLSNYTFDAEEEAGAKPTRFDDIHALLPLCPLLKYDSHKVRSVTFSHKSFQEFFVALKIVEEILKCVEDTINLTRMILNQKSLVKVGVLGLIFRFLVDAVHDQTLQASALIKLIQKSKVHDSKEPKKQSEMKAEDSQEVNIQKDHQQHNHHPLSIAAANAITILNASGYDFSRMDFSEVCIPNANLSYGVFEETNFTDADLQGVDFSESWLQGTLFIRANMKGVSFGVTPNLILDKEGSCIAHSPVGNHMAVGTTSEIIIFERQIALDIHFRELRRLRGHVGKVFSCSFSKDGKYLVTGGQDRTVRIWEIQTGECLHILKGHKSGVVKCVWSRDERHVISVDENQAAIKWSLSENGWVLSFQLHSGGIPSCGFIPNDDRVLLLGNEQHGFDLYSATTGAYIRQGLIVSKDSKASDTCISSDGKWILVGICYGMIHIIDFIRGHISKSPKHMFSSCGKRSLNSYISCSTDEKLMMSTTANFFQFQDTNGEDWGLYSLEAKINQYSMDPGSANHIAASLHDKTVTFLESNFPQNRSKYCEIKGSNEKGLRLVWANIDDSSGLSEENVMIFDQRGDYEKFGKKNIQELILSNQAQELEKITTLDLSNRKLRPSGTVVIGRNTKWTKLEHLDLSYNGITDEKAVHIGNNLTWKNLQELMLSSNEIADKAAAAIAGNPSWKNLRKINLSSNNIGDAGAKALGSNSHWRNLEDLNLSNNEIDDEGSVALGKNTSWKNLKKLNLCHNSIEDEGAAAIARNSTWNCLEVLELSYNSVNEKGATALGKDKKWKNLKVLSLDNNQINESGASKIVMNSAWISLEELYLFENDISDEFAETLRPNQAWNKMRRMICHVKNKIVENLLLQESIYAVINLPSSHIDDSDAVLVGKSLQWVDIRGLFLQNNMIGNEGAVSLGSDATWANLVELRLSNNYIGDEGAIAIGKNPVWRNLERLHLNANLIGDEGAIAIGANTTWTKLEMLELNENRIGDKGAAALGQNTAWGILKLLNLDSNNIGDEGAISIGSNTTWMQLGALFLQENAITDKGAVAIGNNKSWSNMRQLILSDNKIGDVGAIAIGANTTWILLKMLVMRKNNIGDEGAIAIGSNTTWVNLERLELLNNIIGDEGAMAIGKNVTWSSLKELNLGKNRIGEDGGRAIGSNTTWPNLHKLSLFENEIWNKAAEAIGNNTAWNNLKELDLSRNRIGNEGARVIGANTTWSNLETLELQENIIGDEGAVAIGENTTWSNLQCLMLYANRISDKGTISIGSNKSWTSLTELHLSENQIGDKGAVALGNNCTWNHLQQLGLSKNQIGDEGGRAIGANTTWINLEKIELHENAIGDEGAKAIGKNTTWTNLTTLSLAKNRIGEAGGVAIGSNKTWINLEELELRENTIGDKGATAIGKNNAWSNLKKLHLNNNRIGDTGAIAIGKNTIWINLSQLFLPQNEIGNKGAIALANNTTWSKLEILGLYSNRIGDEGIIALRKSTAWPNLELLYLFNNKFNAEDQSICDFKGENLMKLQTFISPTSLAVQKELDLIESSKDQVITQIEVRSKGLTVKDTTILVCKIPQNIEVLDLSNNNIGDMGATIVGVVKSWRNLKKLDLSSNQISDISAVVIGQNESWKNLQELVLSHNQIGTEGAITIERNYFFRNLIKLDLSANKLGDEAAVAIARNRRWIQMEELLLSENEIGDQGATLLAQNVAWKKLIRFEIHSNQHITETGKKALQSNSMFGSFVSV